MGPQRSALKKHRTSIDKFLLDELEKGEVQDLTWMNKAQGIFQVPWVHGSIKNFDIHQDRSLQMRYEVFRGKQPWIYTVAELNQMKPRFRNALNKSRTIKCIKKEVAPAKSRQPPFRIYGFVNWQLVYDSLNYEQTPCDIRMENNTENVADVGMPGEYDEFIQGLIPSMSPENNEGLFVNAQEVGEVVDTEQSMEERSVNGVNDIKITQDMWAAFMDAASQAVSCSQVDAGCTADVNDVLTADVGAHDPQIMQSAPCAKQMLHENVLPMEQIHAPWAEQMLHEQFLSMEQIHAPCAEQMLHEQFLPMEQIHVFTENVPNWKDLGMADIEDLETMEIEIDQAATPYEDAPLEPGSLGFPEVIPPDLTDQVPEPMLPPSPFMEYVKMDFGSYASSPFEECLFGLNDN